MRHWAERKRRKKPIPRILGLTGSIAMGKSTIAAMARKMGIPTHDSDHIIHSALEKPGPILASIKARFPTVVSNNRIDRAKLGALVFADQKALLELESLLHPVVLESERRFLTWARSCRKKIVLLDIPLLFETKAENRCDYVIVASAPSIVQHARALRRKEMSPEKLFLILQRQLSDREKRRRADFVILTGMGKRKTWVSLRHILKRIASRV